VFLRLVRHSKARADIESFLFRYFLGYRRPPYRIHVKERRRLLATVEVEEVFTFLSERSRAPSTSLQLRTYSMRMWETLVQQVAFVFSHFQANRTTRATVRRFHKRHIRTYDTVISFNYDTIFENSLPRGTRWAYHGIDDSKDSLPILKPHGSINWERTIGGIALVSTAKRPVIVAPTHLKFVGSGQGSPSFHGYLDQAPQIRSIWEEMEREMRAAKLLVFIGYSFPVADLYFSSVLRTTLADREGPPDVVIVNPDAVSIADRLQRRFPIPHIAKYFDFGQFIEAGRQGVQRAVRAISAA
jgi:hypothetical protein